MLRWAEIYLNRLKKNYENIKKAAKGKQIIAVVKANGYGHGSVEISQFLEKETDVSMFAVATAEEGAELREGKIKKPILVMSNPLSENIKEFEELNLTPVVFDFESLKIAKEKNIPFHIKIDTGMGRLGFLPSDFERLYEEIKNTPNLTGVMSHFSDSDRDKNFTENQFSKFLSFLKAVSINRKLAVHIDNSGAIPHRFNNILTHSRVGIALYGSKPTKDYPITIEQVMEIKSKIIQIKNLPNGWYVSYGRTYKVTEKNEKVGVVAFGYADGLIRALSNKWQMKVNGIKCPIRGRICMDMTVISLQNVNVKQGDVATVTDRELTFDKMAEKAGTISYEIMCDISPRVKRVFIK